MDQQTAERIAAALERIADALERHPEMVPGRAERDLEFLAWAERRTQWHEDPERPGHFRMGGYGAG